MELKLTLVNDYIRKWAAETPDKVAIVQHEDGKQITFKRLATITDFFALRLMSLGVKKGDIVATQLALFPEHVALMYACLRIGAIFAPLDLRLKKEEVKREFDTITPVAFFFLGKTPIINFSEIGEFVRDNCKYIKHLIQVLPQESQSEVIDGATSLIKLMNKPTLIWLKIKDLLTGKLEKNYKTLDTRTPAIIIFTTGTTGTPKPALICHENIIVQSMVLIRGSSMGAADSTLVNLPPSHVGCITETLMTTLHLGATAVILRVFDVRQSLEAIEKWKVTILGQIPTQFRLMWAHPDYAKFNLSSLKFAVYGGSSVDVEFLQKLSTMAPKFGTGMGLTECAGFITFTPIGISAQEMSGQVGEYYPDIAKITIRKPMNEDRTAGEELPDGEVGEICYEYPIVFLGYYKNKEATDKAISKDGFLYSGDVGYFQNMGTYRAMYLAGRKKFIIKQKGYQVFPDEVQNHIATHPKVDIADVLGIQHKIFDEGIFAFVRPKKDVVLTADEIHEHCRKIASFKRPQHIELWEAEKPFPLTRSAKVDKLELQKIALEIVDRLRAKGQWDATN